MPNATKTSAKASKHASAPKPAARKTAARSKAPATPDAIQLLITDHKEVKALFKDYDQLVKSEAQAEDKQTIAVLICTMLTAHATVEEELFYPAARAALEDDGQDLLDEAVVEHASAKDLIAQIEDANPGDELFDAKVQVLGEYIRHHVKEEETELFPKVKKAKADLVALGAALAARKEELVSEQEAASH